MLQRFCRALARALCATIAALLAGTAVAEPLAQGSTLCLHPIDVPLDEHDGAERRQQLQRRLRDALAAASFKVPDPTALKDSVTRIEKEFGGFLDPATGKRDTPRYRTFIQQRAETLRRDFGCEAELIARVVRVQARFANGVAVWDGTHETVSSTGRRVMNAIGGVVESGWVAALSLWLHAVDLDGNDLAFRSAGIECLGSLAVLRDEDALPPDLWLSDSKKLDAAIQSALGSNGFALRHLGMPVHATAADPMAREEEIRRALGRPSKTD